jgi:hypothetical protein
MSRSIVLIEYDAINPSMPDSTQQWLVVDSFKVPASGDITEVSNIVPTLNGLFASGFGDTTSVNHKQAVVAVMDEAYLEGGRLRYGNLLIAFNVDDKGNVTQEGTNGLVFLTKQADMPWPRRSPRISWGQTRQSSLHT